MDDTKCPKCGTMLDEYTYELPRPPQDGISVNEPHTTARCLAIAITQRDEALRIAHALSFFHESTPQHDEALAALKLLRRSAERGK